MCLYPRMIKNRKYTETKKNGGQVPPVSDNRTMYVPIGCQNCMECRKQKAREWQIRLQEDLKEHKNGKFITLTFSNESILEITDEIVTDSWTNKMPVPQSYDLDNAIATKGTRLFLERWRKEHGKSLRHWLVTELGHNGTENIHMHGIVWTDDLNKVEKIWKYGFVWKGKKTENKRTGKWELQNYVNAQTVNYIIKYVTKPDVKHETFKSKILTSPGIGGNYTKRSDSKNNKYNGTETIETYRTGSGQKMSLPIYYRNKIYTEEEREQLWINRLNKEERWINGIRIDISKGLEQYNKSIKYAREQNKRLGYKSNMIDKEREDYEIQQRKIMQETRIIKAMNKKITNEGK